MVATSLVRPEIVDDFGGDVSRAADLDPPTAAEDRYDRVHRVLRRYDEYLGEPEHLSKHMSVAGNHCWRISLSPEQMP